MPTDTRIELTTPQASLLAALPAYADPRSRTAANLVARGLARWMNHAGRFKRGLTITPQGREALRSSTPAAGRPEPRRS